MWTDDQMNMKQVFVELGAFSLTISFFTLLYAAIFAFCGGCVWSHLERIFGSIN